MSASHDQRENMSAKLTQLEGDDDHHPDSNTRPRCQPPVIDVGTTLEPICDRFTDGAPLVQCHVYFLAERPAPLVPISRGR